MDAYTLGREMHDDNYPREENPFGRDQSPSREMWFRGWDDAAREESNG